MCTLYVADVKLMQILLLSSTNSFVEEVALVSYKPGGWYVEMFGSTCMSAPGNGQGGCVCLHQLSPWL